MYSFLMWLSFQHNCRYAQYSRFKIHSEVDYYKLEIDGYEGNAGDSLNDSSHGSNNSPFSTYNRDNDRSSLNCANMLKVCSKAYYVWQALKINSTISWFRVVGGGSHAEEAWMDFIFATRWIMQPNKALSGSHGRDGNILWRRRRWWLNR